MRIFCVMMGAWLMCSPALAQEQMCCRDVPKDWYFGIAGYATSLRDYTVTTTNVPVGLSAPPSKLSFSPGYGFSGNLGYRVAPFARVEGELAHYVTRNYDATNISGTPLPPGMRKSGQRTTALMANAYLGHLY